MTDQQFLQWLHDRIVQVYGENYNVDFLHRLRSIIQGMPLDLTQPPKSRRKKR